MSFPYYSGGRGGSLLGDGPPPGGDRVPDRWDDGPQAGGGAPGNNFNNEPAFFNEPNPGQFNNRGGGGGGRKLN